jgi:hypothetical protein
MNAADGGEVRQSDPEAALRCGMLGRRTGAMGPSPKPPKPFRIQGCVPHRILNLLVPEVILDEIAPLVREV